MSVEYKVGPESIMGSSDDINSKHPNFMSFIPKFNEFHVDFITYDTQNTLISNIPMFQKWAKCVSFIPKFNEFRVQNSISCHKFHHDFHQK